MATTTKEASLKIVQKDTVDIVASKVKEFQESGELSLPSNYSPENAMKSAWLTIQEAKDRTGKPALSVVTRDSVANALLNMVVQSLNPAKKQCYFIVYGNQLILQRSYFGSMHVARMVEPLIKDIIADVVYVGDTFKYQKKHGSNIITEHVQELDNIDKSKIRAAYCTVIYKDGTENTTIMTINEIKQAWSQSQTKPVDENGVIKSTSVHGKFTEEMAKKTVINRACKTIINSSDDSSIISKIFKKCDNEIAKAEVQAEISENANTVVIDVDPSTGEVLESDENVVNNEDEIVETTSEAPLDDVIEDDLP